MNSRELNQLADELVSDADGGNYKEIIIHTCNNSLNNQLSQYDFAIVKSRIKELAPNLIVKHQFAM